MIYTNHMSRPSKPARSPSGISPNSVRSPTNVDAVIGKNLCLFRNMKGFSQEALGENLGVSFQQIQKYENGKNRISASRLYHISLLLELPIQDFFKGVAGMPESANDKLLTLENIELFTLIEKLATTEKKETAKALLKALR